MAGSVQSSTSGRLRDAATDLEGAEVVGGGLGRRDGARQGDLGGVVDDVAELRRALSGGLEGGVVHLPDPVAARRRLQEASRRAATSWRRSAW